MPYYQHTYTEFINLLADYFNKCGVVKLVLFAHASHVI